MSVAVQIIADKPRMRCGVARIDMARLGERMRGFSGTLVSTNLTDAERARLLETFGS